MSALLIFREQAILFLQFGKIFGEFFVYIGKFVKRIEVNFADFNLSKFFVNFIVDIEKFVKENEVTFADFNLDWNIILPST